MQFFLNPIIEDEVNKIFISYSYTFEAVSNYHVIKKKNFFMLFKANMVNFVKVTKALISETFPKLN